MEYPFHPLHAECIQCAGQQIQWLQKGLLPSCVNCSYHISAMALGCRQMKV